MIIFNVCINVLVLVVVHLHACSIGSVISQQFWPGSQHPICCATSTLFRCSSVHQWNTCAPNMDTIVQNGTSIPRSRKEEKQSRFKHTPNIVGAQISVQWSHLGSMNHRASNHDRESKPNHQIPAKLAMSHISSYKYQQIIMIICYVCL